MDSIDFGSTDIIEIPIKLDGRDYLLREASTDAVTKYRNAQVRGTKFGADGKPTSMDGVADAEPILVSECLFVVTDKGGGPLKVQVGVSVVRGWKYAVVKKLYDKVREISPGIADPETAESLTKQIADLTEKLKKLEGDAPKASTD